MQTLSGFIQPWVEDTPQVSEAALYLMVEEAVRRLGRAEFARVAGTPGLGASLARTLSEFSSAGCDGTRLAATLPEAPLAQAFLTVYREVERELERRGLALRAGRLELAAARLPPEVWMRARSGWMASTLCPIPSWG